MSAPIVFFDIAGPSSTVLNEFYSTIFAWEISADGTFDAVVTTPIRGAIRQDPSEKRIYLGVEDVNKTLEKIEAAGGSIDAPRFEVPGVVILGLFRDPAGNPLGLVETANGTPKIP